MRLHVETCRKRFEEIALNDAEDRKKLDKVNNRMLDSLNTRIRLSERSRCDHSARGNPGHVGAHGKTWILKRRGLSAIRLDPHSSTNVRLEQRKEKTRGGEQGERAQKRRTKKKPRVTRQLQM